MRSIKKKNLLLAVFICLTIFGCKKKVDPDVVDPPIVDPDDPFNPDPPSPDDPIGPEVTKYDPNDYYDGYYSSLVSWENGEDLVEKLNNIISNINKIPYSDPNWESNKDCDKYLYDQEMLDVVYSNKNIYKDLTVSKWQREHCFPASLMCGNITSDAVKELGRATDFHNLFASESSANSSRGNKNYGVADKRSSSYQNRTINNGEDGYSFDSKNFEPANKDKGRVSRAIFYMATMYNKEIFDNRNNIMLKPLTIVDEYVDYAQGTSCQFKIGNLSTLLNWANTFDVDEQEYYHNESVYKFKYNGVSQNNRNPYVDYPELVDYAFGSKKNQSGKLEDIKPSFVSLNLGSEDYGYYSIKTAKRTYDINTTILNEDINVVYCTFDSETKCNDYTISTDNLDTIFNSIGNYQISLSTPKNSLSFEISVINNYVQNALYKHTFTAKSAGQDFNGCYNKNGVINELTLDGLTWQIIWNKGSVQSNDKLGVKFGTNSTPIEKIVLTTKDIVNIDGKTNITGIYLDASAASQVTYKVVFKIDDVIIETKYLNYIDSTTSVELSTLLSEPISGRVSIEISGITKSFYLKSVAIDVK